MDTIRVLIADDHPGYRSGIEFMLSSVQNINVVGSASSGEEAMRLADELQPDVILMDIHFGDKDGTRPAVDGIEATRRIIHHVPHIRILILTLRKDADLIFSAMRAGALGYLSKDADKEEIVRAIQAVSNGEAIFSPEIAVKLTNYFARLRPEAIAAQILPELSPRENEILALIAQGMSNVDIATKLGLQTKTVKNHITNIFDKLQVSDRAQAILRAKEAGLGRQIL